MRRNPATGRISGNSQRKVPMSVNVKEKTDEPVLQAPAGKKIAEELEELEQDKMDAAKTNLTIEFGLHLQAPESITIEVLKQLIRERPRPMAYALKQPLQTCLNRNAALLLLIGEDSAKRIVKAKGDTKSLRTGDGIHPSPFCLPLSCCLLS